MRAVSWDRLGRHKHQCIMAANMNSLNFSKSNSFSEKENEPISQDNIPISEEDIPGATLPRDSPEECKVKQLQRWLLCRGAKTTGKKEDLVQRLVILIIIIMLYLN